MMDIDTKRQICDNNNRSAVSPQSIELEIEIDTELAKRTMKLDLIDPATNNNNNTTNTSSIKHRKLDERSFSDEVGSPKSPTGN